MKKTIRLSLIAASVLALTACNQEAKQEQAEVKLDTVEQQQAYGIGASVGNSVGLGGVGYIVFFDRTNQMF